MRAELTKLRLEQRPKMSQTRLGHAAAIAKSTVNRIENVYGEPDHVPDIETIERWVLATGLTLSSFFARIEGLQAQPLVSTTTVPLAESEKTEHATPPVASSPSVRVRDLEVFGRAFGRAIVEEFRRDSQRKNQSRPSEKPKRRARPRGDARRRG